MQKINLDPIDRRILTELQADGRITNVELSKRARISAPPCLRRVRALEKAGFIKGYHADLDVRMLGYEVQGFAMVGLRSQARADLADFETRVLSWDIVRDCTMLSGEVDFILRCVARDLDHWNGFIAELTAAPNVASVKTSLAVKVVKREPGVPIVAA